MRLRHFAFCFVLCLQGICPVSSVAVCVGPSEDQAGLSQAPIEALYRDVVDILFPCKSTGEYYLVLRFLPSWTSESQIVISRNNGSYDVDYYFLPEGSKRIADQIHDMIHQDVPYSPQEMASRIRVEHKRLSPAPPAIPKLMTAYFALKIPPQLQTKIVVDGTRYDFWFVTLSARNVLHVSLNDYNSDGGVRNPVAVWMNRVKEVVDRANPDRQPAATGHKRSPSQRRVPSGQPNNR